MQPIKSLIERAKYFAYYRTYIPTEYYVYETPKIVYISIPKVACTSIKLSLAGNVISENDTDEKHMDIHKLSSNFRTHIPPLENGNYYTFAFVRNPFDRLISCYKDKVKKPIQHNGKYHFDTGYNNFIINTLFRNKFTNDMSFQEFVELVYKIPDWLAEGHFKSQHSFLYPYKKKQIDFIGKLENIEQDWAMLARQFGFNKLVHGNQTKSEDISSYYNNKNIIDKVAERYKLDIDTFNYQNEYKTLLSRI